MRKRTIFCSAHGRVSAYCICLHVKAGAKVGEVERPGQHSDIGSIVCDLKQGGEHTPDEVTMICSECAAAQGYVRGKGH